MFADVLLPLSLTLIMGSLGLTLTLGDFRRVVTSPKGVGIGLVNLLLISPLLAFGVGELYGLAAVLAVGVVLLGASPGGTTANMFTHLARGDVALSVSMTAVSSVASVITVPVFLSLAADHFGAADISDQISMPGIAARVFLITLVPLSIGMLIRAKRTEWTLRNMQRARRIALVAFVLVVAGAVITEIDAIADAFAEIAVAVITLNVLAMTISFLISRAAKLSDRQATAIALELGVHNTTVALAVATAVDDELTGPAAVYGLFMFLTAGLFARFMAKRNTDDAPVAESVGRGTAEASIEVEADRDTVWRAISTEEGLSTWLAPAQIEGGRITLDFGDLGRARGHVVAAEPPVRFAFAEEGWLDGAPPLLTELQVESDADRSTRVRVVNRIQGGGSDDARRALAAVEDAWRPALAALRLSLARPADAPVHALDVTAPVNGSGDAAWERVLEDLGLRGAAVGARARVQGGPTLAGRVEHADRRAIVLRLDEPAAGYAILALEEGHDATLLSVRAWFHGEGAQQASVREQPAWEARLNSRFDRTAPVTT